MCVVFMWYYLDLDTDVDPVQAHTQTTQCPSAGPPDNWNTHPQLTGRVPAHVYETISRMEVLREELEFNQTHVAGA